MRDTRHGHLDALRDVVGALLRHDRQAADERMASIAYQPDPVVTRRTPPVRTLAAVFERDRYQCRYCEAKTVLIPVLRLISTAYPREFPYHRHGKSGEVQPAFNVISVSVDHVVPITRGGVRWIPTTSSPRAGRATPPRATSRWTRWAGRCATP